MFGSVGLPELLLIFVIALLLFGPRKLPEIGKTLGKALNEFKRASNDLQRSLEEEVAVDELKQAKKEVENAVSLPPAAVTPPAAPAAGTPEPGGAAPSAAPVTPAESAPTAPAAPEPTGQKPTGPN